MFYLIISSAIHVLFTNEQFEKRNTYKDSVRHVGQS